MHLSKGSSVRKELRQLRLGNFRRRSFKKAVRTLTGDGGRDERGVDSINCFLVIRRVEDTVGKVWSDMLDASSIERLPNDPRTFAVMTA